MLSNNNQEQLINILNIPLKKIPSYNTLRRVMMGVFESEIQLIFDEIISANDSEHQEDWIAVDEKS
jgi:hypothetical protein